VTPTAFDPALENRLRRRFKHLRKWARRRDITCYRVYERDIPDHPLVVDWYDGDAVAWLSRRKKDETPEQVQAWEEGAVAAVGNALGVGDRNLFVKHRERQKGASQYERVGRKRVVKEVEEGGLRFEVNLSDYLDVGLFLDHRPTRALVRELSDGLDVLNLFAYTGAFTCYAAAGGAKTTLSVDMSATYCAWAERNLRLNGFEPGETHWVWRGDCLEYLTEAPGGERRYDLIVCDPPTFSNSKRMDRAFSVSKDQALIFGACHTLLRDGGELIFSTNDRGFRLDEAALPPFDVSDITAQSIPEDFRNTRIHRCWRMRKR
jgi:23S rRNA G2069 N7-methylase RlmK/C1962 C5-methylase RlmI